MSTFQTQVPEWFERNGAPVFEDENRGPVSIAQARRQGLLPSVRNLLGVIARPAMDQPAETVARSAQLCANIQRGAERVARGLGVEREDPARRWLWCFREWFEKNCREVRWIGQTAIHQVLGYAATPWMLIDHRDCGLMLVDLKIQGLRGTTGPSAYRLWGYEMAASKMALQAEGVTAPFRCLTLVMNSQEPHPPVEASWSQEHLLRCRCAFLAARQLWVIENGYDPLSFHSKKIAL